jgi:hypothetical protein
MPEKDEHELTQAAMDADAIVDGLEAKLKAAKLVKVAADEALIKYLNDNDLKGFKSASLNVEVNKKDLPYVSIEEGKEKEAFAFIDEELGRGDAIKPTIHHKTLTSLIMERVKNAETVPEGVFKKFWKSYINIQKL